MGDALQGAARIAGRFRPAIGDRKRPPPLYQPHAFGVDHQNRHRVPGDDGVQSRLTRDVEALQENAKSVTRERAEGVQRGRGPDGKLLQTGTSGQIPPIAVTLGSSRRISTGSGMSSPICQKNGPGCKPRARCSDAGLMAYRRADTGPR